MTSIQAGYVELLRHGDTGQSGFRGRLEDLLTPLGWKQMEQALQGSPRWHAVLSSPRMRCAHFAAAYATRWGLPLEIDEALAELDFGLWEGVPVADIQHHHPDLLGKFWADPWSNPPPQGESLQHFEQRLCAVRNKIQTQYAGQRTLVITHAGVIRYLLYLAHPWSPQALWQWTIPHASRHRLPNGL